MTTETPFTPNDHNATATAHVAKLCQGITLKPGDSPPIVFVWEIDEAQHMNAVLQGWFETTWHEEYSRLVTSMRLFREKGLTVELVRTDVAEIRAVLRIKKIHPTPSGIAQAISAIGFKQIAMDRKKKGE